MLWVCLSLSLIGLFLLAIGVSLREPVAVTLDEVSVSSVGDLVSVTGVAENVQYKNGNLFFRLASETGSIRAVMFESDIERQGLDPYMLENGLELITEGRIQRYKGMLELVAQRVTLLSR